MQGKWKIFVDTGGTFTDCIAHAPDGEVKKAKVLSSSSLRLPILQKDKQHLRIEVKHSSWLANELLVGYSCIGKKGEITQITAVDPADSSIYLANWQNEIEEATFIELTAFEEAPILAARLLTATPLSQALPPIDMRLGSTKATNALLERKGTSTLLLITQGFADLLRIGNQQRPELFALNIQKALPLFKQVMEVEERLSATGEIILPLTTKEIQRVIRQIQQSPHESIAISFMHAYRNPAHEQALLHALQSAFPNKHISTSAQLSPGIKFVERTATTVTNAYLAPIMERYLGAVESKLAGGKLQIMNSAGSLIPGTSFFPKDSLLSGPAGGVVGAALKAKKLHHKQILTLDMGGTSTDVARFDGTFDYRFETQVGDAVIQSPSLAIETVAAGGGSICAFDGFKLAVGPASAGAEPGPACYGAGGPLSLTDVNLLAGRLVPGAFGIPLDRKAAEVALEAICAASGQTQEQLIAGFLAIANEKMADAMRNISVRKGYDPRDFALFAFGGAGGQHACQVAELLGIERVLIPTDAGVLSAYGMGEAAVERFAEMQVLRPLIKCEAQLEELFGTLAKQAQAKLEADGFAKQEMRIERQSLFLRFEGQSHDLEIPWGTDQDIRFNFRQNYEQLFGHWLKGKKLEVTSLKLWMAVRQKQAGSQGFSQRYYSPISDGSQRTLFHGKWKDTPFFFYKKLQTGASIAGPAIILSDDSTLVLDTGWDLVHESEGFILHKNDSHETRATLDAEATQLELFTNRFKAIAEEMGALLLRTAFSTNIKERLDFSCALLDAEGELIANAPHIPVHLGSLGMCVRKVKAVLPIEEGDVIITNHPDFGGSHLPDISLIRGVFVGGKCVGYLANRAHHAEIGGSRPGSMPPDAQNLAEEGVVIAPTYLIRKGESQWPAIEELLTKGLYPSRNPQENEADLRAAIASLLAGEQALQKLCRQAGTKQVAFFLQRLKSYAHQRLQHALQALPEGEYRATESLDDGSQLAVRIQWDGKELDVDFSGCSDVHPRNLNATPAIVNSAILYVLRLMLKEDLPLNEGLMQGVNIKLPHSMLNPLFPVDATACPAVVGGNTETSQRLVDTLLKALNLAACSQGTMNNVLFGNADFGYYETICGGTGAGPGFDGADAVHQHMTNTRITDPEVLELRYPVRLEQFAIRQNSGGSGYWRGGDGIIRKLRFLAPVALTVLTQHRAEAPYGKAGGVAGATGRQFIIREDGTRQPLAGIDKAEMQAGDCLVIETPGGGGWGEQEAKRKFNGKKELAERF